MSIKFPPREKWARLPTPIEKLEHLSKELGLELFVKRDDQTGFEWSGNKIRKLEFFAADAKQKGATCLVTCGGVQSNHCRATAALAAKLGLRCVLLLRGEAPDQPTANNLLDQVFGAEIFYLTHEQYYVGMAELRLLLEEQIKAQGGKTYFIPEGGSSGLGCFGYASAYQEIAEQENEPFDSIVVAHGSGGTLAGLVLGKLAAGEAGESTRIVGVNVCYGEKESFRLAKDSLWQAIQHYRLPLSFAAMDLEILNGYIGKGYAKSSPDELKFILKVARADAMLLDPVYTGKALFGFYQKAKAEPGFFGKRVLFIHTGGGFGVFAQGVNWKEALA